MRPALTEVELKFKVNQSAYTYLKRSRFLRPWQVQRRNTRRILSIYYDTTDLDLLRQQVSLRVRAYQGRYSQSLKTAEAAIDGIHRRTEWEDTLHSCKPDFAKLSQSPFAELFCNTAFNKRLSPCFRTDVQRTAWIIAWEQSHLEIALDWGAVWHEDTLIAPIQELEIELMDGAESGLHSFSRYLNERLGLSPENTNKAELGYRYLLRNRRTA